MTLNEAEQSTITMNDETGRTRRCLEVTAAVALWIGLGMVFHLSANAYLLLGIPLTAAFQWGIRRQPLRALWVRDAAEFRLGAAGWGLAAILAAYPCYRLVEHLRTTSFDIETGWYMAAIAGAVGAAYSLRNFRRATLNDLCSCFASAGSVGVMFLVISALSSGVGHHALTARLSTGVTSLLLYVPVVFVLEEVAFRGAFDAHIHHPGEARGYLSATYVSALWGLWHIPVAGNQGPLVVVIIGLVSVHCALGGLLSIHWRRSGNLFVPGLTHAVLDAIRNALFFVP